MTAVKKARVSVAKKVSARPAEATGGLAGLAVAVAGLLGASAETLAIVGTAAGVIPGCVTYLVNHGGLAGIFSAIIHGE